MRTSLIVFLFTFCFVASAAAGEIRLSAAASTTDAVKAIIILYEKRNSGVTIQANYASSGTLSKQISVGAPTDLFISANPKWMNYLINEKQIAAESVHSLAGNSLVLVGNHKLDIPNLNAVVELKQIAIGNPKSVPAGQYAEQALRNAGLFDQLQGKLVMAKDARQALIYADRGDTEGAIVYRSDALLAQEAVTLFEIPQTLYSEIVYPVGLTSGGMKNPDAVAFLKFLKTEPARSVLTNFGFRVE